MLELILSGFVLIAPTLNTQGSCTLDAYIQCQMREHKELLTGDYIDIVNRERDKMRDQYLKETGYTRFEQKYTLQRLKNTNRIKAFREVKYHERDQAKILVTKGGLDQGGYFVRGGDQSHAMCIIGVTDDYFIIINNWGPLRGYKGYGLVSKNIDALYYTYER